MSNVNPTNDIPFTLAELCYHLTEWLIDNNLNYDDVSLSHGGSLLLLGLTRLTNDIDLTVSQHLYDQFLQTGKYQEIEISGNRKLLKVSRRIDIHTSEISPEELSKCLVKHHNGIWYRDEHQTLRDYLRLDREKDQPKIKLLCDFINNRTHEKKRERENPIHAVLVKKTIYGPADELEQTIQERITLLEETCDKVDKFLNTYTNLSTDLQRMVGEQKLGTEQLITLFKNQLEQIRKLKTNPNTQGVANHAFHRSCTTIKSSSDLFSQDQ